MHLLPVSLQQGITALPGMRVGQVSTTPPIICRRTSLVERWSSHAVRIWDTIGEDQVLKGEYKVISGKM
jgi:hypothetical protein